MNQFFFISAFRHVSEIYCVALAFLSRLRAAFASPFHFSAGGIALAMRG
jgi:hypothetical protein